MLLLFVFWILVCSIFYPTPHVCILDLLKKVFKIKAVHKELYWYSLDLEIRVL